MKILLTGGAGFIGSAIALLALSKGYDIVNVDCLTYAANLQNLKSVTHNAHYSFENVNICDADAVQKLFDTHRPDAVMHLAAETHVDRSIDGPDAFMQTNIIGTYNLLQSARTYWDTLPNKRQDEFRFHHISTDEVYGDLSPDAPAFSETTPYNPSSPYAASKAASDHIVRAWARTYGLPTLITNCSNNYGPYQFPEKLIPTVILNALFRKDIPIYGTGDNIRDWLYVDDHADALLTVLQKGELGHTYNIGANNERTNLEIVETICTHIDARSPDSFEHKSLITYVQDRPGHDRRYAINSEKIFTKLGWIPSFSWEAGLQKTLDWYIDNEKWWRPLIDKNKFGARLGLMSAAKPCL